MTHVLQTIHLTNHIQAQLTTEKSDVSKGLLAMILKYYPHKNRMYIPVVWSLVSLFGTTLL